MAEAIKKRRALSFTADDERVIAKLKKQLRSDYGEMTVIALVRKALRTLAKEA